MLSNFTAVAAAKAAAQNTRFPLHLLTAILEKICIRGETATQELDCTHGQPSPETCLQDEPAPDVPVQINTEIWDAQMCFSLQKVTLLNCYDGEGFSFSSVLLLASHRANLPLFTEE